MPCADPSVPAHAHARTHTTFLRRSDSGRESEGGRWVLLAVRALAHLADNPVLSVGGRRLSPTLVSLSLAGGGGGPISRLASLCVSLSLSPSSPLSLLPQDEVTLRPSVAPALYAGYFCPAELQHIPRHISLTDTNKGGYSAKGIGRHIPTSDPDSRTCSLAREVCVSECARVCVCVRACIVGGLGGRRSSCRVWG